MTSYGDFSPPASVEVLYYVLTVRSGVRVIECDGIMVEVWS